MITRDTPILGNHQIWWWYLYILKWLLTLKIGPLKISHGGENQPQMQEFLPNPKIGWLEPLEMASFWCQTTNQLYSSKIFAESYFNVQNRDPQSHQHSLSFLSARVSWFGGFRNVQIRARQTHLACSLPLLQQACILLLSYLRLPRYWVLIY